MFRHPLTRSLIPAAVLAVVVLSVFSKLQNYGPESAVRRFHEALLNRNEAEIEEVLYQPWSRADVDLIVSTIYPLLADGARIRLRDVERTPTAVRVTVYYYPPGHMAGSYDWIAEKTPTGWKVDADSTTRLWVPPIFKQ